MLENEFGRQACFHAQHQSFGAGDVVDRNQKVGDVFHLAAVAEGAEIGLRAREARKDVRHPVIGGAVAAGEDDEIAFLRL